MKQILILIFLLMPTLLQGADSISVGREIQTHSAPDSTFTITMDLDALRQPVTQARKAQHAPGIQNQQAIVIEIAENKSLTFIPSRYNAGKKDTDFSWFGKSADGKAKAILSVRNGVLVGTVTCEDGEYKIYPENGHFKVIKLDPNMAIPFHNDTVTEPEKIMLPTPQPPGEEQSLNDIPQENDASYSEPLLGEYDDTLAASQPSATDSVVTVLAYYTQALKDEYGATTEAMIQANLDLAKDAYIDSDTEINLQITMLKQVPASSLLSTANPSDLNDLLNKLRQDGLVRYEREFYQADAVTVFSKYPDGGGCGLGQMPTSATNSLIGAYSAVHIKQVPPGGGTYCDDLSFAHELGHNFGCAHDSNHSSIIPMYAYAYGYDVLNKFGTIMSYDGPKIGFFSNPRMSHTDGTAIGNVTNGDNARTIKENQSKMADNTEQISEALESSDNDTFNNYAVSGKLGTSTDRDGYVMWLEGSTAFDKSYHGFYMNIYNEETHQLVNSSSSDVTITLQRGRYRVVVAFADDGGNSYYLSEESPYTIDITTEYAAATAAPLPGIILYLIE